MGTPQFHRNGVYYARLAVPADLWNARGKKEITKCLGTRDPKVAVSLFKIRVAELEEEWAGLRAAAFSLAEAPSSDLPVRALTHMEAHALAGELYRKTMAAQVQAPGAPDAWLIKLRVFRARSPPMPRPYVRPSPSILQARKPEAKLVVIYKLRVRFTTLP
ncbi:DUF6538 domain-containing protein [Devosia psychrophila]|uniref:DUF6538 domain-containing protein n=1 Tax=Devosia psychrophila TaxID=728005 RepID=A0A0F5PZP1_9HYPH|nr:DUF6538 domain-containing protein [Devosia psychrophila]KKC33871.1 hypothetical protein WH91_05975 [Devosia psychrophila]SFD10518.1 hypothetical protein SAMN04488059_12138 [Devosia psychrophila]